MGEWVPSEVTEARLLRLVERGILPPKEVTGSRVANRNAFLFPQLGETVSFTDFHECGFAILALDFFHGFLHEYDVQLQLLLMRCYSCQASLLSARPS
jgi:hypothetical protein